MRLGSVFSAINLARKAIATANRNPQDIPEVLRLVNRTAQDKCGKPFWALGIQPGFEVRGRGYDALPAPGYPTCWIWCPNGYRFKIGLDAGALDILGEDVSHMG